MGRFSADPNWVNPRRHPQGRIIAPSLPRSRFTPPGETMPGFLQSQHILGNSVTSEQVAFAGQAIASDLSSYNNQTVTGTDAGIYTPVGGADANQLYLSLGSSPDIFRVTVWSAFEMTVALAGATTSFDCIFGVWPRGESRPTYGTTDTFRVHIPNDATYRSVRMFGVFDVPVDDWPGAEWLVAPFLIKTSTGSSGANVHFRSQVLMAMQSAYDPNSDAIPLAG